VETLQDFGIHISPEVAMKEAVSAIHSDFVASYTSRFAELVSSDEINKDIITCIVAQRHDEMLLTRGDEYCEKLIDRQRIEELFRQAKSRNRPEMERRRLDFEYIENCWGSNWQTLLTNGTECPHHFGPIPD
jgi:hypothetical protein